MEAPSEALDPAPGGAARRSTLAELEPTAPADTAVRRRPAALPRGRLRTHRLSAAARQELLWICVVYLSARALLVLVAFLLAAFGHYPVQNLLANWDGLWYRDIANNGYPHIVSHYQTNLGFFPLYPMSIWLVEQAVGLSGHDQIWSSTYAGLLISGAGGLVATVFIHRLADGWWGRAAARRATVLFTFFAGGVVFSMVYSEGLLLPLAAICIWALERKRWLIAGGAAAFGTAVQPVGLLLGVVCGVAALQELWRGGWHWRSRDFLMSVAATAMSSLGVVGFLAFLWAWTGSPMATFTAQHYGWREKTDFLAVIHSVERMFQPDRYNRGNVDLNLVAGTLGALLMLYELWLLFRYRREVSLPAIAWTLGVTFLAFTSEYVPPNPRLVITAFPMLLLIARRVRGKWFAPIVFVNAILFTGLSLLTFYQHLLRP